MDIVQDESAGFGVRVRSYVGRLSAINYVDGRLSQLKSGVNWSIYFVPQTPSCASFVFLRMFFSRSISFTSAVLVENKNFCSFKTLFISKQSKFNNFELESGKGDSDQSYLVVVESIVLFVTTQICFTIL